MTRLRDASPTESGERAARAREPTIAARAVHYRAVAELFDRVCDLSSDARARALDACDAPADVIAEVRELLALDADPSGPLPASVAWDEGLSPEVGHRVRRLAAQSRSRARYERLELIAEGGMGSVHVVWDRVLGRRVAMKSLRERGKGTPRADDATRAVARFLEEARIAGQLDHPGIVPVHDLGIDATGRLWFTMPLVRGRTLHDVVRAVHAGEAGWTRLRVLGLLQRACEALAYAHAKGVVHRDLKPANVMVGRHGETCVMDWGLARLLDEPDIHDLRIADGDAGETLPVRAATERGGADWEASPLLTLDGEVLGTPAYMSPEQARGEIERIGPATDVYAMGCILYELLGGRAPYAPAEGRLGARAVWHAVLAGPPRPLHDFTDDVPPELHAICERAMARDVDDRYAGMQDVADDLRAYLEGRVVSAHATGALAELRKWVGRNRVSTVLIVALLALALGSAFVVARQERARAAVLSRELDARVLTALVERTPRLSRGTIEELDAWLTQARRLLARRADYQRELDAFEAGHASVAVVAVDHSDAARGLEALRRRHGEFLDELRRIDAHLAGSPDAHGPAANATPRDRAIIAAECDALAERVARAEHVFAARRELRYADAAVQGDCEALVTLADGLAALDDGPESPMGRIRTRLEALRGLRARTVDDEQAAWDDAIASIADPRACPLYDGLVIRPQEGLVPLGRDARSGLWEFWHVQSGERPVRDAEGRWTIGDETGLVFVLVPGGTFAMGAQRDDPDAPGWLRDEPLIAIIAMPDQQPVQQVPLDPYFLSKYELTQGQWWRAARSLPSTLFAGRPPAGIDGHIEARTSRSHPVESLSFAECVDPLAAWGLVLPTEARWERAARAGGTGAFGPSQHFASVLGQVNFADASVEHFGMTPVVRLGYDDGRALHGPVDMWEPNAFGFCSILGNVREWCLDEWQEYGEAEDVDPHTGERHVPLGGMRVTRGGGFLSAPNELTVSFRDARRPGYQEKDLGLRPARDLDP